MRKQRITDWLATSDWASWARAPVSGDASARSYERLTGPNGTTVILMDAPPDTCGTQTPFVTIATHLRSLGLAAPQIHVWDDPLGLLVLEDLGKTDFAAHLRMTPTDAVPLYTAAVDVLLMLGATPPPPSLSVMTHTVGAGMIDLAFSWAATDKSADLHQTITQGLTTLLAQVSPAPATLSLRDFHAENLIWRPGLPGHNRVGLLDFQDAFVTHPAYDLASLLRDARRDVDPALLPLMLRQMGGDDAFRAAFHIMAVQRNLRILGIFQRLAQTGGKTKYLALIPRVRAHLRADLATPYLRSIAVDTTRAFGLE